MDSGKVSESVLKRSVLKYVTENNKEVDGACRLIQGAGVGADCAVWSVHEADKTNRATASAVAVGRRSTLAAEAIVNACNNLICGGAEAFGAELTFVLPQALYESELRHMMEDAQKLAKEQQITLLGGHTMVSAGVSEAVVTATVLGKVRACSGQARAGMDIVMSKWIGLQGTARLAEEQKELLEKRLPIRMLTEAAAYNKYRSIVPEAKEAWKFGAAALHDVSGGGIFRALWEMAEAAETGLRVDLKKIPVKQETIEICEVLGLNPYELLSGGALLMAVEDGEALAEQLNAAGIPAAVIGRLTDNNDRVLIMRSAEGEEVRFLEKPRTDEIDKV